MKIKRLTKVLAIILVISMLPLWMLGCGGTTGTIRERLVELMIGDGKLDDENGYSQEYVKRLDADVDSMKLYFDPDVGYWEPSNMLDMVGSSYEGVFYENLYTMTVAWATKTSKHYHDGDLLDMVEAGFEYLASEPGGPFNETWQNWIKGSLTAKERLDASEYIIRTLLILTEEGKMSDSKAEEYAVRATEITPSAYGKGVELARSAYVSLGYAALIDDEEALLPVIEKLAALAMNVTNGAGLYADGSFITDPKVASSGSYGVIAFSELVEITYAIQGEPCDFSSELNIPAYLYNWAVNSIMPSLYNGRAFASTSSSFVGKAEYVGGRAVSSMIALADYFDEADDNDKANSLRAVVKGYSSAPNADFFAYLSTYGATRFEDIMDDEDIAAKYIEGAYSFAATDKLNIIGPKYSASLSLSSIRTAKYETRINRFDTNFQSTQSGDAFIKNPVNGNGWYSGDGALMIYTSKYAPGASYWKYVNGERLPGSTVATIDRTLAASGNTTGNNVEAGSVTIGNFAVSAMHATANNADYNSTIDAKKSWFFFDNEIVALGAGINSKGQSYNVNTGKLATYSVVTNVENVYYGSFSSIMTADSIDGDVMLAPNRQDKAGNDDAIYVMNYGGIYVPAEKNDELYYSLNKTDGGNFVEVWLDHSEGEADPYNFSGKTYEYVIVPATTMNANGFYAYVKAPDYTVLANTEQVQAVKDASSGMVGYTFWEAASVEGYLSSDFACTVLVKETDTTITIAVSDFTHTVAQGSGNITLNLAGGQIASISEGLTLNANILQVDRTVAANGNTLTVVINK